MKGLAGVLAGLGLFVAFVLPAQAGGKPEYRLTDLGRMAAGTLDINNKGEVVGGLAGTSGTNLHAARRKKNGKVVDLGPGLAWAIANTGQVVGWTGDIQACLFDPAWPFTSGFGVASSISPDGHLVTGWMQDGNILRTFLLTKTTDGAWSASAGTPGQALGVNNSGVIAGQNSDHQATVSGLGREVVLDGTGSAYAVSESNVAVGDHNFRAFRLDYANSDVPEELGALYGDSESVAYDINGTGVIVGRSSHYDATSGKVVSRAFIYSDMKGGTMRDLNGLWTFNPNKKRRWVFQEARAISNRGAIVGWGLKNGRRHAFLLTPNN